MEELAKHGKLELLRGPCFVPLPPPTTEEVERLLASLARRLLRRLQRLGAPPSGPEAGSLPDGVT